MCRFFAKKSTYPRNMSMASTYPGFIQANVWQTKTESAMLFLRDRPYNDLPTLPPNIELETPQILKKLVGAHKALAELKGIGPLIPNQSIRSHTSIPRWKWPYRTNIEHFVSCRLQPTPITNSLSFGILFEQSGRLLWRAQKCNRTGWLARLDSVYSWRNRGDCNFNQRKTTPDSHANSGNHNQSKNGVERHLF